MIRQTAQKEDRNRRFHPVDTRTKKPAFDLTSYFQDCQSLVNQALEGALPKKEVFPAKIHEAMRYSLFAGGKRIRPILCMAASEACGGGRREVLPVACALEMIHTFSLIHDDLPAMDDDNLRRGLPTNHKVYGEATSILAGDALVSQAFVLLGRLGDTHRDPRRVLQIIQDIALATGSLGMVGGQLLDLESEGKKLDLPNLQRLHELKTGRLITVSITGGAKLVNDCVEKIAALERYGEAVGLAFQITDDILDIEGGIELGKDIGSDQENNKATYPSVMGIEAARKIAHTLGEEAMGSLKDFGEEADPLRALASFIVERKK